ncbi:MAG: hypothetical protein QOD41_3452 [Cryptosporangiaceae bacterium]|nr:hypothetical protein [Cryptosporangiaceae bacterium]
MPDVPLDQSAIVTPRPPLGAERVPPPLPQLGSVPESPDPATEFARRVLRGWHFVAEMSVLGQPMCACGQPSDYCEYRLLAARCGVEL